MSVKTKKTTRTNDVLIVLSEYQDKNGTMRAMYAIKALKRFFMLKKVTDIDVPLCHQYVAFRMDQGVTMSTAARELTVLRSACNHALKWKRIRDDQKPTFEIPTDLPRREIWLFKDELRSLIIHSTSKTKAFIEIAYGTGSRRKAIETLEWYQCDLDRRTISLAKRYEPRSNKRRPVVPMGDLFPLMKRLHSYKTNKWVLGDNKDLFYDFTKTCKEADLLYVKEKNGRPAGKITPHILRHSRATHLLEDGVSIYAVAKLLGDNPTTVQSTYGHISMDSLEDELAKSTL